MSFHNKLAWFKYPNSLKGAIYVILVAAARDLCQSHQLHIDSVIAVVELFDFHILHHVVPVTIVAWSGQYFLAAP